MHYSISVKILAGTFKTLEELLTAAINARTYSGTAGINTARRASAISQIRGAGVRDVYITPSTDIWIMDAYKVGGVKGGANGMEAVAASWAAGDFTGAPGGGSKYLANVTRLRAGSLDLGSRVVYAVADSTIFLEFDS